MALELKAPQNVILKPIITVFGVGGAGGNAVNNMILANLQGANFVVANTDAQALKYSECPNKVQLGAKSTQGLGAGASPDVGNVAAEESEAEIRAYLEGSNMVFITCGMGGGTGTGASPVIARIAKELGILTVGVVTKPFLFEGPRRMRTADKGITELQKHVDTLIIIPNQNLFRIANENTTFPEAFKMADEVLHAGVRGVTDLITMPGLINLDFADIKTVMIEKGKAMMGTGEAQGEDRAVRAAESAISNPLLDHSCMKGAKGVLINITGGKDMTLYEVDSAANRIREEVGDTDANIIFGSTFNPEMEGVIRVSVVATGIDAIELANQQAATFSEMVTSNNNQTDSLSFNFATENENINSNIQNIDEQVAPSFEEYQDSAEFTPQEDESFEKIAETLDWTEQTSDNNDKVVSNLKTTPTANISTPEAKHSLLKRMWNALKTADSEVEENIDKNKNTIQPTINSGNNNVQDVPSFLRRK